MPSKSDLLKQISARLQSELDLQTRAAHLARDEAISEESRAENKYDTHSQEAAYLAEGQAKLAAEIVENLKLYQSLTFADFPEGTAITLGALVELKSGQRSSVYFVGPRAGGLELNHGGVSIVVVTPQSPLGRQLIGRQIGDTVNLPGRTKPEAHRIITVR